MIPSSPSHGELNVQHAMAAITLVGALVALAMLAACGGSPSDPTPAPQLSTPTAVSEPEPTPTPEPTVTPEPASDGESEDGEESDPDVLFRFMNAVNTLYAGQNEESIPAFDLIIRVHPEMPRAYYYRGVAFYRSEQNEMAMADFEKSIDLDPESGDTYLQRALLHHDMGDSDAALDDFNTAIDLAPWLADAYRNRGALLINNGQSAPGRADLERALEVYLYERNQERVDEVRELLANPPEGPIEMFKATDILPRLP